MRTQIQGVCPACGWGGSIFVGDGGYLTCSRDTCPNPCAPSEALGVKFPEWTSKAPSSPAETTEPVSGTELHVGDSDAAQSESMPNTKAGADEARVTKWADLILDATGIGAISEVNTRSIMGIADAENAALTAALATSEAEWQAESDARDQDFADYSATLAALERVKDVVRAERQDDADDPKRRAYQQGRRDMTRVFRAAIERQS